MAVFIVMILDLQEADCSEVGFSSTGAFVRTCSWWRSCVVTGDQLVDFRSWENHPSSSILF